MNGDNPSFMPTKLLFVDDEPDVERMVRQRMRTEIRESVYSFVFARNGEEALDILKKDEEIEIILCDINMPVMDGLTLLTKLKELDRPHHTIMVSAYGEMEFVRTSMNRGAFDFLVKPINFNDLRKTVEKTIESVQTLKEAIRAQELALENKKLNELDMLKTEMFTNISHELRTPLTIITGIADQIEERPDRWLAKGIKMIKRNSHQLLNLVNQILELRKLESGKLTPQFIQADIIPFIKYLFDAFQSYAEQKDLALSFSADQEKVEMDFDPEKIQRIIANLLSNAIKYTPVGGEVKLSVHYNADQSTPDYLGFLDILVSDNGIGIEDAEIDHIFDRFYQSNDSSPEASTGIGLAIVKEFVDLLNGQIKVSSTKGAGSTFQITLPVSQNASPKSLNDIKEDHHVTLTGVAGTKAQPKSFIPIEEQADALPSVLIVEDNEDVAQYLAGCLDENYSIIYAQNGKKGIEKAIECIPDLIISDVMMPEKNGYEVCETLKTDRRTSHIPIILLTAKVDDTSKIEGLTKGADAYLAKPFNKVELLVRIQTLLENRLRLQEYYRSPENTTVSIEGHQPSEDEFIQNIRRDIEANLDDEHYGIHELCRSIGMSRSQLHRKIKALTGRSTSILIRSIRLHHAQRLLRESALNIAQVAFEVGFKDPKYFSRTFTEEFNISPKDYRKEVSKPN